MFFLSSMSDQPRTKISSRVYILSNRKSNLEYMITWWYVILLKLKCQFLMHNPMLLSFLFVIRYIIFSYNFQRQRRKYPTVNIKSQIQAFFQEKSTKTRSDENVSVTKRSSSRGTNPKTVNLEFFSIIKDNYVRNIKVMDIQRFQNC